MAEHVDFAALATEIDAAAPRPGRARGGRPPFPTELMVRVLVIQQLYNLSDEQIEFQLLDRLSFQRFVGLRLSLQAPDRTAIWMMFKERLIKAGASEQIFEAMNRQLDRHGYIARGGQIPAQGTGWQTVVGLPGAAQPAHRQDPRPRGAHLCQPGQMGGKALRSIGLARATLHLNWKTAAYNLRRLCTLMKVGPQPF